MVQVAWLLSAAVVLRGVEQNMMCMASSVYGCTYRRSEKRTDSGIPGVLHRLGHVCRVPDLQRCWWITGGGVFRTPTPQ